MPVVCVPNVGDAGKFLSNEDFNRGFDQIVFGLKRRRVGVCDRDPTFGIGLSTTDCRGQSDRLLLVQLNRFARIVGERGWWQ